MRQISNLKRISGINVTYSLLDNINLPRGVRDLFTEYNATKRIVLESLVREVFLPNKTVTYSISDSGVMFNSETKTAQISMYLKNREYADTDSIEQDLRTVAKELKRVEHLFYKVFPELRPVKQVKESES
jgi:hypothetical protein